MKKLSVIFFLILTSAAFGWQFGQELTSSLQDYAIFKIFDSGNPGNADTGTMRVFFNADNEPVFIDENGEILSMGGGVSPWKASKGYKENEAVLNIDDNQIYSAKADFTSGASFDRANWNIVSKTKSKSGVFFNEGFENAIDADDFTCSNDPTFGMTGTAVNGSLTNNPLGKIKGENSLTFTQAAGSLNDWCLSPSIPLEKSEYELDKKLGVRFKFKTDSDEGDYYFVVWDETNSKILNKAKISPTGNSDKPVDEHLLEFEVESSTRSIRYGHYVATENSGTYLTYDDLDFETDPYAVAQIFPSTDPVDYVPATQGVGVATFSRAKWHREGAFLVLDLKFTAGTVSSSELQIGFPDGLVAESSYSLDYVGDFHRNEGSTNHYSAIVTGGDSFLNAGIRNGSNEQFFTARDGDTVIQNGDEVAIRARVKIAGWSSTKNTFITRSTVNSLQYENNFTGSYDSGEATLSNAVKKQTPSAWITNTAKTGTSNFVKTFTVEDGVFSEVPNCTVADQQGSYNVAYKPSSSTATSLQFTTRAAPTDAESDRDFTFSCTKGPSDYVKEQDKVYIFESLLTRYKMGEEVHVAYKGNEKVYEYCNEVASDITSSTTIETINSGLNPYGHNNAESTFWVINNRYSENGSGDRFLSEIYYDRSNGNIRGIIVNDSGSPFKIGAGVVYCLKYTK